MRAQSALRQYSGSTGTSETPAALIARNIPLARRIAWHLHGKVHSSVEVEDLIQIGTVALVEAAHAHDGVGTFEAYASMRIRGAILDELRRRATMSRGALRRRRALITARDALAAELGRAPHDTELAARLGLAADAFASLLEEIAGVRYTSIDEVYSDHSQWFADEDAETAFDAAARSQLSERLAAVVGSLPEREALVLQLYFVEELNLAEIGEVLNVTAARVCQLKAAALSAVRSQLLPDE